MQHFHSFEELGLNESWATIGTFDGVHRGHQALLMPMIQHAHRAGVPAAVVTFSPHPVAVLRGITEPMCLTSPEERAHLLGELGVDVVLTLKFERALAAWTAEEFMQQMRVRLGLRRLFVGHDFALGRNRQGNIPRLREIGAQMGYTVEVTDEVRTEPDSGERISSSRIRMLVNQGQVAQAAGLLGRPYAVEGPVAHGDGRGRTLGFPTANIQYPPDKITPTYGVYATWAWVGMDGAAPKRIPSVTSVGVRPTFDPPDTTPRVEAYLIDYEGDLYGQMVRIEFIEFLRPELRFHSVQTLIDQMILDTQHAREVLAHDT
jgi:riboflavin kinase/FMN adenylyltransferase